jgi:hypothetical protein
VGRVSSWVDPDSPDPVVARDSSAALRAELGWAAHLGLQAVLLPPPPRPRACAAYARALTQVCVCVCVWWAGQVMMSLSYATTAVDCLQPSPV